MPRRSTILTSATITLVLTTAMSAPPVRSAPTDDECLAKPNGPAPQGQHWYYRIDHANNKRQCWHLGPEGLPVQKSAPQVETNSSAEAAKAPAPPRAQKPVTPALSPAPAAGTTADNTAVVPPIRWLDMPKLQALPRAVQPMTRPPLEETQTASAADAVPSDVASKPAAVSGNEPSSTGSIRADKAPQSAPGQASSSPQPAQWPVERNRIFVLLMVMFALLGVTGPILHFAHRRRHQREFVTFKPPRWAPVAALHTPTPRIRTSKLTGFGKRPMRSMAPSVAASTAALADQPPPRPVMTRVLPDIQMKPEPVMRRERSDQLPLRPGMAREPSDRRPAPPPVRLQEPNERLVHALQQLVDRIQTNQRPHPDSVRSPLRRADVETMKNAR